MLLQQCLPFTVLKQRNITSFFVYRYTMLQQCLPFTVLKLFFANFFQLRFRSRLQQCLPFTVLKLNMLTNIIAKLVATVLTVYGIETN